MLRPEDVLDNRYRLDQRLATGGMGDVWRATDLVLGRTVAVKVLLPALLTDPGFDARFRGEARMMATLRHPGVVDVYDYGKTTVADGTVVYLVMAFVNGEPLSQRIAAAGRLSVNESMSAVAQAADALEAVHANGIIHRDVKPANLLVQPDGTVVLVDFGIAHSTSATRLTSTNMVLGTAVYMAPEQVSGRPVSAATDVYALGAVAYHCLAGQPPFNGDAALQVALQHMQDEPPPLPADVPPPVQAVIRRALAKDPADRYPSAAAFAAAARAAMTGTAATAAMTGPAATAAMTPTAAALPGMAGTAALPTGFPRGTATVPGFGGAPPQSDQPDPSRKRATVMAFAAIPLLLALAVVAAVLLLTNRTGANSPDAPSTSSVPAASASTTSRPGSTRTNPAGQNPTPSPSTVAPSVSTPGNSPNPGTSTGPTSAPSNSAQPISSGLPTAAP